MLHREQQLCDQKRQIEEKHWLQELEMETIKQKVKGQSTKATEEAPAVKIVTKEEYIEFVFLHFGCIYRSSLQGGILWNSYSN